MKAGGGENTSRLAGEDKSPLLISIQVVHWIKARPTGISR